MEKNFRSVTFKGITWVDIAHPNEIALDSLRKNFHLQNTDVDECSPILQRPKLIDRDNYLFMILLFPFYDGVAKEVFLTEIDFFVLGDTIITVHEGVITPLTQLFERSQSDAEPFKSIDTLLFGILNTLFESVFPFLLTLSNNITALEQKIFTARGTKTIEDILQLKRSIVNTRRAMLPHKEIIRKLIAAGERFFSTNELHVFYNNLVDQTKEIWETLENHKETINALYEANVSLYSLRLNGVMRSYTIVSVVIFAMTFTAALFSVRATGTPFINLPMGFWIILAVEAGVAVTLAVFFRMKKWM